MRPGGGAAPYKYTCTLSVPHIPVSIIETQHMDLVTLHIRFGYDRTSPLDVSLNFIPSQALSNVVLLLLSVHTLPTNRHPSADY